MKRVFLLCLVLLALTDCGIRRPLIAPKDIPDYEARQKSHRDKMNSEPDPDNSVTTGDNPVRAPEIGAPNQAGAAAGVQGQ